jgi:hypothetical protein
VRIVEGAERIHLSLSDDASVDAVLEPLAGRLPAGASLVDHTTTAVRPTAVKLFGNLTLLGLLGILGDVGRLAAAVGIDMKDAFSPVRALQPRPDAAAARQAHQRRKIRRGVVRDVDGAQGFAVDGGRGGAWGEQLVMVPALAKLLDEAIQRGEGRLGQFTCHTCDCR